MRSGGVGRKLEPATRLLGTLTLGFAAMVSIGSLAGHAEDIAKGPLRVLPVIRAILQTALARRST
jgi:hypothetical protein